MCHLLSAVNYLEHKWLICGNLKVVELVQEIQAGYIKYLCFLYLWDSQVWWPTLCQTVKTRVKTWLTKYSVWHFRWTKQNTASTLTRLGVLKNFLKSMDREGKVFAFSSREVPSDKQGETQGWCIWRFSSKRTHEGPNVWRST